MKNVPKLIIAADFDRLDAVDRLIDDLPTDVEWYKIGKQMFTRYGPKIVDRIKKRGRKVFLDLKFHDIPNTVAKAVAAAAEIGADMTNVHAVGGRSMMLAAVEELQQLDSDLLLIGVTVLTSIDSTAFDETGQCGSIEEQVTRLASLAQHCGLHGVVSSAREIGPIRQVCGTDFILVVPGIRPPGAETDDQKRVMTPAMAAKLDANFIVVGRPITKSNDPHQAAQSILDDLTSQSGSLRPFG